MPPLSAINQIGSSVVTSTLAVGPMALAGVESTTLLCQRHSRDGGSIVESLAQTACNVRTMSSWDNHQRSRSGDETAMLIGQETSWTSD